MLGREDDITSVKIIDYGFCLTKTGPNKVMKDLAGTAYYLAPEVIKGRYNIKCDLWSMGVIMFTMLTG